MPLICGVQTDGPGVRRSVRAIRFIVRLRRARMRGLMRWLGGRERPVWMMALIVATYGASGFGQTMQDGIMLARGTLCTGVLYTHDAWDSYWEGTLQRVNGNIGTI